MNQQPFVPNAVFIPDDAIWKDNNGSHVDPDDAIRLFVDGNLSSAQIFTKEEWDNDKPPSFVLEDRVFYRLNGDKHEPLGNGTIDFLPDMWCVKEDETEYWDAEFRAKHGIKRIYGVYIFNRMKHVHLCEITPSYEREFMGSQYELEDGVEDEEGRINEAVMEADNQTDRCSYMHVADVERSLKNVIREGGGWLPVKGHGGYKITGVVSVTEEDAIEELRESQCNGDL